MMTSGVDRRAEIKLRYFTKQQFPLLLLLL